MGLGFLRSPKSRAPKNISYFEILSLAGTGSLARSPLEAYTRYPEQSFAIGTNQYRYKPVCTQPLKGVLET